MKRPVPAFALLAVALLQSVSAHPAARLTLRVSAAASLTDAFNEIAHAFEKQHPGLTVQLNLAGSQQLVAQIEQGSGADVFASADDRWMTYAREHRLLGGLSSVFAHNPLVAIIPRTNPARIRRLQDLARRGIKFITSPDAVPVGRYTRAVLANLSHADGFDPDYGRHVLANVVSEEENVKAIVAKIQLGEGDAGIVYRSDVTPSVARRVRMIQIPASANVLAAYPIAVLEDSRHPGEARSFIDFVLAPEGQKILARWGFVPVSSGSR